MENPHSSAVAGLLLPPRLFMPDAAAGAVFQVARGSCGGRLRWMGASVRRVLLLPLIRGNGEGEWYPGTNGFFRFGITSRSIHRIVLFRPLRHLYPRSPLRALRLGGQGAHHGLSRKEEDLRGTLDRGE